VSTLLLSSRIHHEHDVVSARQRARQISAELGFDTTEQTRIATAVSEIARNAYTYASGGRVEFSLEGVTPPQVLCIRVIDTGPGVTALDAVMSGSYKSPTGMGLGIVGTRRLMDRFDIQSTRSGTTVTMCKILPRNVGPLSPGEVAALTQALTRERPVGAVEEVQAQNRELLRVLDELNGRREELERVNRELEDTNRGVVALYAELDERANHLRRADELKTRFLSNMTHEFRTPVNSIIALTGLLAERLHSDKDEKDEVFYIRRSAEQLSDLVNDLLDIAKVEAGKIEVRPAPFEVRSLFGALRGMLRPLLVNQSLSLVFEDPDDLPPLFSDESKVSQILRNFISNALKYTESGEVRVTARRTESGQAVVFSVSDTGIGIPPEHLERVFDEFAQIENPLQRRTKGTGLGLSLSKRLCELLGGTIGVQSTLGVGSTFYATIPILYRHHGGGTPIVLQPGRVAVLVIDDSDEDMLVYERLLSTGRFQVVPARSLVAAEFALSVAKPAAIILDLRLQGEEAWNMVARLKQDPETQSIPLIIGSSIDDAQKGLALGADAYAVKPIDRTWLLDTLDTLVPAKALRVLIVDDEETSRYIVRELLKDRGHEIIEATTGLEGLRRAEELTPDILLVDIHLGDIDGVELVERLRASRVTSGVPIIVLTAQVLDAEQRRILGPTRILSKSGLNRMALQSAILETLERA